MRFVFPAYDHDFRLGKQSGAINGGTAYLWHLAHTLQNMGHDAQLIENGSEIPCCDVVFIQSEWYGCQVPALEALRANGTKLVVLLGHFKGGVYFDPKNIEADLFVSTWKGQVVDTFKQEVKWMPHAYCAVCDKEGSLRKGDIVWVGNKYPLRNESWLDEINPTKIQGLMPDELGQIYRGAQICPNIHGKFQQGEVATDPSTLADVPGFACNERLFQITGSGGFQIADNNPQIKDFFTDDELVTAENAEDFKKKIKYYQANPQEKEKFIEKGKSRVLKDHTYHHRCQDLLNWLEEIK